MIENIDASLEIGYRMIIPESVKTRLNETNFWNPQNHGDIPRYPEPTEEECENRRREEHEYWLKRSLQILSDEIQEGGSIEAIIVNGQVTTWKIVKNTDKTE